MINHELRVGEWDRYHNRNQCMVDGRHVPLGKTFVWWKSESEAGSFLSSEGVKDSSRVQKDKLRWEGSYNRDIISIGPGELQQRLTPFEAVREPFLHSRPPQPFPLQAHLQHSDFSVSCLCCSLPAVLIALLCSHFLLSNGDLAIFDTENQRNRNSALRWAPFSIASLIPSRRIPQSLQKQLGCSSRQEGGFPWILTASPSHRIGTVP